MKPLLLLCAALALLIATAAPAATAKRYTGTISEPILVADNDGNGTVSYGDTVTFEISTNLAQPFVHLECSQSGVLVAEGYAGYFEGALGGRDFGLYSGQWTEGPATCTASITSAGAHARAIDSIEFEVT